MTNGYEYKQIWQSKEVRRRESKCTVISTDWQIIPFSGTSYYDANMLDAGMKKKSSQVIVLVKRMKSKVKT